MTDDEIVEYILKDEEASKEIQKGTILNILTNAMIQKGWFTEDEFNKAVESGLRAMAKAAVDKMSKETKEAIEMKAKIEKDDLFGSVFKDLLK